MQTHCPHCETHFRITESQIDIADGDVRCGVCKEIFNVYEVTNDVSPGDERQLLLDDIINPSENIDNLQSDIKGSGSKEKNDVHDEVLPSSDPTKSADTSHRDETQERSDDFFNEETNKSLHNIIPEDLRSYEPPSAAATAGWSIGILLLISSLSAEYLWFNRYQFYQFPDFQAAIELICQQFTCQEQSQRDPAKIELITRNVYSHPNKKDALMVTIVMRNKANYAQPYPVLQVDFSDIRGHTVAARRFFPSEYLNPQSDTEQPTLLQPEVNASVTLEIKDPGTNALTYEFNFI